VHKKQARWAEYVLQRAGVPLKYRLFSQHSPGRAPARPRRRPASDTWLDRLLDGVLDIW
jgi:hypothetical protein